MNIFVFSTKISCQSKNPPFLNNSPLSPTPPFLEKIFHSHHYCQIRGTQSPLCERWSGSNYDLPIQNPAVFKTMLSTLHKHMAHHNTNNSTKLMLVMLTTLWNSTTSYEDQHITQRQNNITTCSLSH